MDSKKTGNNMLEFMYDPTAIPVRQRLYFRPEENLQNEAYEKAVADARASFGSQGKNSDFYPSRKKSIEREASMDRKTIIASLDVLSQNFNTEDPIGKDLRTMAYAVANMSEQEFAGRLSKEEEPAPVCEKCKKEPCVCKKEAAAECKKCDECGKDMKECICASEKKKKAPEVKDFWTKEASDAVQRAILADCVEANGDEDDNDDEGEEEETGTETPETRTETPETMEEGTSETPETEKKEKKKEKKEKEAAAPVEEKKIAETPKEIAPTPVDTSILAYDGIEMEASMGDTPDLSAEEKAQLDKLFN